MESYYILKGSDSDFHPEPSELWRNMKNGNKNSLSEMFSMHYEFLFKYGVKISPNQELVKDCIQELFLNLWENYRSLGTVYCVKSYLCVSLRRMILRETKQYKNRNKRFQIFSTYYYVENINVEDSIILNETLKTNQEKLVKAYSKLSDKQKEVINPKYQCGLSSREIEQSMGIKRQSVYNHISEAIKQLKKCAA